MSLRGHLRRAASTNVISAAILCIAMCLPEIQSIPQFNQCVDCAKIRAPTGRMLLPPNQQQAISTPLLRPRGGGPIPESGWVCDVCAMKKAATPPTICVVPPQPSMALNKVKWGYLSLAVAAFATILACPFGEMHLRGVPVPDARRCLAILSLIGTLWSTEAIPLHVASLLIPFLTVAVGALRPASGGGAADVAKEMCGEYFNPTILLFLAGFSIGAVLEKQRLSRRLAAVVLRPFGTNPTGVLLGIMLLGVFMSMWISNVPAAVLCTSLAQPILEQLEAGDPFAKCLLLGIAFSNNIGGMTTPIASPQNVVAFSWLEQVGSKVTFLTWSAFALPFCSVMLAIVWSVVTTIYPPKIKKIVVQSEGADSGPLTASQYTTIAITVATVACWAFWTPLNLERYLGAMGLVGIMPVAAFFTLGLLEKEDFNTKINWAVLILIGGGLSLGRLMQRSKLLEVLSVSLQQVLGNSPFFIVMAAVALMMSVFGNFASSVVIAIITLPVIAEVGKKMGRPAGLILAATIMNTGAMALPVASFPNANSFGILRRPRSKLDAGKPLAARGGGGADADADADGGGQYLSNSDYVVTGGLITLTTLPIMLTLGSILMSALNI